MWICVFVSFSLICVSFFLGGGVGGEYRGGLATTLLRHVHTEVAVPKTRDWGGVPPKPCLTGLRVF